MSSVTPSAQYRLTIRVEIDDTAGTLAQLTGAIGEAGGIVVAVDAVEIDSGHSVRDIVVDASGKEHWEQILAAIEAVQGARVIDTTDRTFLLHVGRQDRTAQQASAEDARRPLDGLHPGRGARLPGDRRRSRTGPSSTRSSATPSPSSPTAPRCSGWATSARARRCR